MARFTKLLGISALGLAVACGSDDSQPSSSSGKGGSSGVGAAGGAGGSAGSNGASGASGSNGVGGSAGGVGGAGGSTGGASGSGGSTGGTDGSGTGGTTGGTGATAGTGTGATGGTSGVGGTAGIAGTGGTGGVATPYPAGPYGKTVGATIENYQFRGYVNDVGTALSNTLPLRDYNLDDLRKSGGRYALIHLAAFYCAGCKSAADDLGNSQLTLPVQQAGGHVIEVLFSGQVPGSQPLPELSAWITTYDLKVTAIAPNTGNTLVASANDREHAYIVDLTTMKIVWTGFGSYGPTTNSGAKQGLAEMRRLMGI